MAFFFFLVGSFRFYSCTLKVIFSENRESEDSHEKSIFRLFRQNIPFNDLIQGKRSKSACNDGFRGLECSNFHVYLRK